MIFSNNPDKPIANLIQGIILIAFCSIAIFISWILTRAEVHWFFMLCMIVSFVIPAVAAFWLGVKRLNAFLKFDRSSSPAPGKKK
jgi:hypothetical protein